MQQHPLRNLIKQRIKDKGESIPFSEFMAQALYDPQWGYYTNAVNIIGNKGDFTTAPEISSLFSHCIAKQCMQVFQALPEKNILEFGAGNGTMASDILLWLESNKALPEHYFILELSATLKAKQKETLEKKCPHLSHRVHWLEALPQTFTGVILGNEVLDAMPVELFHLTHEDQIFEYHVALEEDLALVKKPLENKRLLNALQPIISMLKGQLSEKGYCSEMNLHLNPWMKSLSDALKEGAVFLIDYGFSREEYYHPDRLEGTLMAHYQHQAHTNPLLHVGEQDITAHVDFTAVMEAGEAAGLTFKGFTTQAEFLLSLGILEENELLDPIEQYKKAQGLKYLLLPSEMGELFKVIAFSKNMDMEFLGVA